MDSDTRERLERHRTHLLHSIAGVADLPASVGSNTIGETEHLASYEQRAVDSARTSMLTIEFEEVDDAITRFDADTYGRCERCGDEIAAERLDAVPAARFCLGCGERITPEAADLGWWGCSMATPPPTVR